MQFFRPPDPVAATFVGLCAASVEIAFRAILELLPSSSRATAVVVSYIAVFVAGAYGFVWWMLALAGLIPERGVFGPTSTHPLEFVGGVAGIAFLAFTGLGLYVRYWRRYGIDLEVWANVSGGLALACGFLVYVVGPA